MENVEEIQDWGPLDENDFPIKELKGIYYDTFIKGMTCGLGEYPSVDLMTCIAESMNWGDLDADKKPLNPKYREQYEYIAKRIQDGLGYRCETRVLAAADYRAPTTRKRWYAIFRCDERDIVWPQQTHAKDGANGLKPWEPIYKYLDLNNWGGALPSSAEKNMERKSLLLKHQNIALPEDV